MFSQPLHETVHWHVLQVRPNSEKKVGARLVDMGFEVCVPTQKQYRLWSDRKKLIDVVLFSNYVFVATSEKRRNDVFLAGSVFKYVQSSGKIAILSEKEMDTVKKMGTASSSIQIVYEGFSVAEEVEIISGSLSGLRGKVLAVNGLSRIQLALPFLKCFANVELKQTEIRKIVTSSGR